MLESVKTFLAQINKLVSAILAVLLQGIVFLIFLQVFSRFVMQYGLPWTEELARLLFMWLCMLGFSVCVFEKSNMGITMLVSKFSPAGQRAVRLLAEVLMLGLFGCMAVYGYQILDVVSMQISRSMEFNMAISYAAVLCGAVLSFFYTLVNLVDDLQAGKGETS